MSRDFYARLEEQLLEAGRTGPVRRRPPSEVPAVRHAAAATAAVALTAGVAIGALAFSGAAETTSERRATATSPPTVAGPAPVSPTSRSVLRGVDIAVLDESMRAGSARTLAERASRSGARIGVIAAGGRTDRSRTIAVYRRGREAEARLVARALGLFGVRRASATELATAGGADVVLLAGIRTKALAPAAAPLPARPVPAPRPPAPAPAPAPRPPAPAPAPRAPAVPAPSTVPVPGPVRPEGFRP